MLPFPFFEMIEFCRDLQKEKINEFQVETIEEDKYGNRRILSVSVQLSKEGDDGTAGKSD
jgi:hypothetical protein